MRIPSPGSAWNPSYRKIQQNWPHLQDLFCHRFLLPFFFVLWIAAHYRLHFPYCIFDKQWIHLLCYNRKSWGTRCPLDHQVLESQVRKLLKDQLQFQLTFKLTIEGVFTYAIKFFRVFNNLEFGKGGIYRLKATTKCKLILFVTPSIQIKEIIF